MRTRISLSLILAALVAFPGSVRGQGVGFAQNSFPTGGSPNGVAVGDFNGDGKLDLAIANKGDNTVSILLGDGKGGFAAKVDFATAAGPTGVAVGDFNGDGKLDLAVACSGANVISILLGNGNGTFASKTDFLTGNTPVGIVAADFNGDGKLDLATANQSADTVSVLLGQGNGTFSAHTDFVAGQNPVAILADDFNGDGKLDLATVNQTAGTVSILLGHGDGTFGQKTDFLTDTSPVAIASADFRNILKRDLVTVNSANSTASVLLGNGNGTFNPRADLGVDTAPIAVTAADFNADGKLDFVAATGFYQYCGYSCNGANVGNLSLRLGDGSGGFSGTFSFPTGFIPSGIAQGDFNGDGRIDLAVTDVSDNLVVVFLQAPAGNLVGPILGYSGPTLAFNNFQIVGTTSAPQTVHMSSTGSFPVQVSTVVVSGSNASEFHVTTDSCSGASVPAGNSCAVSVDFVPTTVGGKAASLTFNSNVAPPLPVVSLVGGGVPNSPVASFSAPGLAFPAQPVGTTSTPEIVAFSNTGGLTLTYTSIALSGPNTADFAFAPDPAPCSLAGGSLAPGASCNLALVFTPSATGIRSATVTISDNAPGSPQTVPLSGTGTLPVLALTLTPPSLAFSTPQFVGTTSGAMPVTLMNSGTAALTIASIAASGDYTQTSSCPVSPATLAAGASCTITITFAPTAAGTRNGAITISHR